MREYVLGLYEKSMPSELSLREMAFMAKEAGYDFLELSIDETEERLNRLKWNAATRRSAFLTMSDAGIPIGSICLSGHRKYPLGHPDPMIRSRAMEIMEDAIGLADDLGIRMIQLAGYDVYYEAGNAKTRECFAENLGKSVAMAAKAGVILAFETMETDFLNTVEKAMYWVERIGSPYLQVYPDSGNITNAAVACGRDVLEDLRAGAGHVAAVHLKETVPGVFREVPYGSGHVDFAGITKTAMDMGVRRFLAEFWYDGRTDWKQMLRDNNRFLRHYLDQAEEAVHAKPTSGAEKFSL